jgi:hypothetical protein
MAPVLDGESAQPAMLHLLTNSLPHTSSGYAQRSHSILAAQQAAGWDVLAVTRLGYPVQVGKILAKPVDEVDGVRYQRLLPVTLAATMDERVQQQAEALMDVVLQFRPCVLHTTTHYVDALVVRAGAAVGIPGCMRCADGWPFWPDTGAEVAEH